MSIGDELFAAAKALLKTGDEEVAAWIQQTMGDIEAAGDNRNIRSIRERQLNNPTGSSTPLHQQISSSESNLHRLQEKATPLVKELLPKLFAIELQNQRIAKLKQAEADERSARAANKADLHDDYRSFCDLLMRLGATPTKVGDLRQQEQAILADLIRWKVDDPRFVDPENPWLMINAAYARRTLERTDLARKPPARSTLGTPPPDERGRGGKRYWRPKHGSAGNDQDFGDDPVSADNGCASAIIETIAPEHKGGDDHELSRSVPDGGNKRSDNAKPPEIVDPTVGVEVTAPGHHVTTVGNVPSYALQVDAAQLALDHHTRLARERKISPAPVSTPESTQNSRTETYSAEHQDGASSENTSKTAASFNGSHIPDDVSVSDVVNISEEDSIAIAERVFELEPVRMAAYWPRGLIKPFNYDQGALVSALEIEARSDKRWDGGDAFLEAARLGNARSFIETRRRRSIRHFAARLQAGDLKALAAARLHGLI